MIIKKDNLSKARRTDKRIASKTLTQVENPSTSDPPTTRGIPERIHRITMVKFVVVLVCLLMEMGLVTSFLVVLAYWIFLSRGVKEQQGSVLIYVNIFCITILI